MLSVEIRPVMQGKECQLIPLSKPSCARSKLRFVKK